MYINRVAFKVRTGVAMLSLILLAGCSSMQWSPDAHLVSVENVLPRTVEMSKFDIYREGEGIEISGELASRFVPSGFREGHISLEIIGQDGVVLAENSTDLHRVGKMLKKPQRYSFSGSIPIVPPKGSMIRVKLENDQGKE